MLNARIVTSVADRRRVIRVTHEANASTMPFEVYAGLRLRPSRRSEADWGLLEEDGEAVSSLVVYPLRLAYGSRLVDAYGIGAVGARPAYRRRGHAAHV